MSRTVCTLNLNGIRSAGRRGFARWLRRKRPDVLCVQELRAHATDVDDDLRCPEGWNARWECAAKKGYAGVGVYSREPVDRYVAGLPFDHCADEGRALRADFPDLSVVSLYVPSGSSGPARQAAKFRFLDEIRPWFDALLAEGRPILVCGDVNIAPEPIDLARPKQNERNSGFLPEERAWFAGLLAAGWVDVVRRLHPAEPGLYSWWSNRGAARAKDIGWRLDHVLATPPAAQRVTRAWIEKQAGLSDHAPVWVELDEA
ncbi:MAG: exodeoxyribonuclease III [Planctomycetes bacterium]|nr:exodeoxyribonuclease III [Planctomycetota bacterium]